MIAEVAETAQRVSVRVLQAMAADLYATAREMRSDFPEASSCYAQRAAALALAGRVLAGIEAPGDISGDASTATHRPATHAHDSAAELTEARKTLRVMSTNEGQLQLRIAQLETEVWKLKRGGG